MSDYIIIHDNYRHDTTKEEKIDPAILDVVVERVLIIFKEMTITLTETKNLWFESARRNGVYTKQISELLSILNCRLLIVNRETEIERLYTLWTVLDRFCEFFRRNPSFTLKARPQDDNNVKSKVFCLSNHFHIYKSLSFKVFRVLSFPE